MDEAAWFSDTVSPEHLEGMLAHVMPRTTRRKLRLFLTACARRIASVRSDLYSLRVIEAAERHADGEISLRQAEEAAINPFMDAVPGDADTELDRALFQAVHNALGLWFDTDEGTAEAGRWRRSCGELGRVLLHGGDYAQAEFCDYSGLPTPDDDSNHPGETHFQQALLRDVIGNPFRPSSALPDACLSWEGGRVGQLARATYAKRIEPVGHLDPERLAVLADAIEESGCSDGALLAALRGGGVHFRGFWALDRALGLG
jgi:hypothetical protein